MTSTFTFNDCCHETKRHLLLERKAMANLDSVLESRDITLLKNIHVVSSVAQSCPTLCNPMDCSTPGLPVRLFATPWTVSCQAPLAIGLFQQEYWSGLPFPSPRGFPDPGVQLTSLASPALLVDYFPLCYLGSLF